MFGRQELYQTELPWPYHAHQRPGGHDGGEPAGQALEANRDLVWRRGLLEENMARMEELYRNVAVKSNAL
jgi:hypothetical protein